MIALNTLVDQCKNQINEPRKTSLSIVVIFLDPITSDKDNHQTNQHSQATTHDL